MANKKIGRNEPCPCGSGKKYKVCCYSSLLQSSDTGAAVQDGDVLRVYSATMLSNRVQREASIIAPDFDELCREHVSDIEKIYSTVASILDFGMREAQRQNDDIRYTLSIVLSNALKSFTAAFALLRTGWRLQPYFCIRNSFEALSVALHLFTNPQDYERFKQDKLDSTKTFNAAKKLMPIFGRVIGDLSTQFVHVGKPFRYIQKGSIYTENETDLWQCLFTLTSLMWFTYQIVELIHYHSVSKPIFWINTGGDAYQLMPKEEALDWQHQIANRFKQYAPK